MKKVAETDERKEVSTKGSTVIGVSCCGHPATLSNSVVLIFFISIIIMIFFDCLLVCLSIVIIVMLRVWQS